MDTEHKRIARRAVLIAFWAGVIGWAWTYPEDFLQLLTCAVGSALLMLALMCLMTLIFLALDELD